MKTLGLEIAATVTRGAVRCSAWLGASGRLQLKLMESEFCYVGTSLVGERENAGRKIHAEGRDGTRSGVNEKKARVQNALQENEHRNRPLNALAGRNAEKVE